MVPHNLKHPTAKLIQLVFMKSNHLYGLDMLRVVSALVVMVYHYAFRGEAAGDLPQIMLPGIVKDAASYGYLGVSVFFIISGFVISYSAENQRPLEFLIARFARIYPTFLIIMSVTATVLLLSPDPPFQIDIRQYAANLLVFSLVLGEPFVDGVYWSIVLEIVFYGWIFIAIAVDQFRHILRIIPIWIAISFINESYIGSTNLQNLFITEHSGFFSVGIIISRLTREFSYYGVALLAIAIAYSLYTSLAGAAWFEETYAIELSRAAVATIIVASVAIFALFAKLEIDSRYWPVLSILGGATYAFYLVHQNVGYVAISGLLPYLSAFGAMAIVASGLFVFSILFHAIVERRLNKSIKRRLLAAVARLRPAMQQ